MAFPLTAASFTKAERIELEKREMKLLVFKAFYVHSRIIPDFIQLILGWRFRSMHLAGGKMRR
jgi:hypothetical protein